MLHMMGAQVSDGYSARQGYEKAQGIPRMNTSSRPQKSKRVWPGLLRIFRQTVMLENGSSHETGAAASRQVHP